MPTTSGTLLGSLQANPVFLTSMVVERRAFSIVGLDENMTAAQHLAASAPMTV